MKHNKKSLVLLASLLLAVCLTVGGTLAFLTTASGPVENTFKPSKVTTAVDETFKNGVKENVKIQNTGDTEAYIRAAIVVTWQDEKGNVYGQMPVKDTDYEMTMGTGWTEKDGFYYWPSPVAPDGLTGELIKKCTSKNTAPDGYALNVEIIGSGIQSKPTTAVQQAWGLIPG